MSDLAERNNQGPDREQAAETPEAVSVQLQPFAEVFAGLPKETQAKLRRSQQLIGAFENSPGSVFICGGFVRDLIMGLVPKDLDLTTALDYEEVKRLIRQTFGDDLASENAWLDETGQRFRIVRLRFRDTGEDYEIGGFRADVGTDGRRPEYVEPVKSPAEDAQRRDFTINSLYYDPRTGQATDYTGGLADIEAKILRFVGNPESRLAEDSLRALRYVRFLFKTGFSPDASAKEAIIKAAPEIEKLPPETRMAELALTIKTARGQGFGNVLEKYKEYGLLPYLLPEVSALEQCAQGAPYHMEGNAFAHTVMVANNLPPEASVRLVLAASLHDIGKVQTREEKTLDDGTPKVSFLRHDQIGAAEAIARLNSLKSSAQQVKPSDVGWLVANHIRAFAFPEMTPGKARVLARHPLCKELLTLAEADLNASIPNSPELAAANQKTIAAMWKRYDELQQERPSIDQARNLINGHDIITAYQNRHGVNPEGPLIGHIKNSLLKWIDNTGETDPQKINDHMQRLVSSLGTKKE